MKIILLPFQFRLLQTLTGHEDWVRGLEFTIDGE